MRFMVSVAGLLMCITLSYGQLNSSITRIFEYRPAPGQFINDIQSGTSEAAENMIGNDDRIISLGGYGGYIIFGFDHRIMNDPSNPYGVDFTVFGNPLPDHAEQGIIRVMKDVNNNGLPDDIWYEITGSDHYMEGFKRNYRITYYGSSANNAGNVTWKDNEGVTGSVPLNSFHTQPYYPQTNYFPLIDKDSLTFAGSRIKGRIGKTAGIYTSAPSAFGYADNIPVNPAVSYAFPDNPYTIGTIEGSGGDAIDISWATDSDGNYVELDGIDFIMIYTGVHANSAWLGEISTEIRGIADIPPASTVRGPTALILPINLPAKTGLLSIINIRSLYFESGRIITDKAVEWISSDNNIALITNGTMLTARNAGEVKISGKLTGSEDILCDQMIKITTPAELKLEDIPSFISTEQSFSISYYLIDNTGEKISGIFPEISISGNEHLKITRQEEGSISLLTLTPGTSYVNFNFPDHSTLNKSLKILINDIPEVFDVSVSMTSENENFLPRKDYTVTKYDLKPYIDRLKEGLVTSDKFISLADVLVSVMVKEGYITGGNTFRFRQDEYSNNKLYLWQFGKNYEYIYGWGGSLLADAYAKAWMAIVNDKVFANGWDTVEIHPGDMISFRHIPDTRKEWSHILLMPDRQVTNTGEKVNFTVKKMVIKPGEMNKITIDGPYLLPDAKVLVNDTPVSQNNNLLTSTYSGTFSLQFSSSGRYIVRVDNASSEDAVITVGSALGMSEINSGIIEIFPNPFSESINFRSDFNDEIMISIYTMDGKQVFKNLIYKGEDLFTLDLGSLSKGVYILQLMTGGRILNKKIIKSQE